ncbi:unnamed protein product, partial [Pylaiella littoralis]
APRDLPHVEEVQIRCHPNGYVQVSAHGITYKATVRVAQGIEPVRETTHLLRPPAVKISTGSPCTTGEPTAAHGSPAASPRGLPSAALPVMITGSLFGIQ